MSKLIWDKVGERFYETGVDHGVLYPMSDDGQTYQAGVAWNGLTSVSLSPEGAEANDIYADNIKYLSLLSVETLKATIEAYQSPEEFDVCDGTANLVTGVEGVTIGQQDRRHFALCFRSKVGNDTDPSKGYKIHIIYGCLASPAERSYETINDSPEAMTLSWEISTTPIDVAGFKPTALVTIDSTKIKADKLTKLEDALYGTENAEAKVLMPSEIIDLLSAQ